MKVFYDHLILIEEIFIEIDGLDMSTEEKKAAKKMSDDYVHHHVLIYILDVLPREEHEPFLERFHSAPYDLNHMKFLEEKTQKAIHAEISSLGKKLKHELLKEIKKHKRK